MIISRHVFFDESVFPYANLKCSSSSSLMGTQVSPSGDISRSVQPCFTHTQSPSYLPTLVTHHSPVPLSGQSLVTSTQLSNHVTDATSVATSCANTPSLSPTSNDSFSLLFTDQTHTQIHFTESSGQVHVSSLPRIGISVVLDCGPSQSINNISESNVLHPVEGLSSRVLNDHSMLTRGKRGICKSKCFLYVMTSSTSDLALIEPHTVKNALRVPEWKQAMQEEYDALIKQHTWSLVLLPPDKNLVSCKWIFKLKRHADGTIARHKARLDARVLVKSMG